MGWNPVKDIKRAVQQVTAPVKQIIKPVIDPINRSDIGRITSGVTEDLYNTAVAPMRIISNPLGIESEVKRAVGSAVNVAMPQNYLATTSAGQNVLDNKYVDKFTLGYSGDYAGLARGSESLARTQTLAGEDQDDIFRWIGKTIAAAFAGSYIQGSSSGVGAVEVESGVAPIRDGIVTSTDLTAPSGFDAFLASSKTYSGYALTGAEYAAKGAVGYTLIDKLLKGEVSAGDLANEYLFDGNGPDLGFLDDLFGYNPNRGGTSSGDGGVYAVNNTQKYVLLGVAGIAGYLLYRRFIK